MRVGRRPVFFAVLALICVALIPPTPPELRWVCISMGALALFWAVLLGLEELLGKLHRGEPIAGDPTEHQPDPSER